MTWAVFEQDEDIHVVPIKEDGTILNPHVLSPTCPCHPEMMDDMGELNGYSHHEVH